MSQGFTRTGYREPIGLKLPEKSQTGSTPTPDPHPEGPLTRSEPTPLKEVDSVRSFPRPLILDTQPSGGSSTHGSERSESKDFLTDPSCSVSNRVSESLQRRSSQDGTGETLGPDEEDRDDKDWGEGQPT